MRERLEGSSPLSTTELENWTVGGGGWSAGREEGSKGSAATSVLL